MYNQRRYGGPSNSKPSPSSRDSQDSRQSRSSSSRGKTSSSGPNRSYSSTQQSKTQEQQKKEVPAKKEPQTPLKDQAHSKAKDSEGLFVTIQIYLPIVSLFIECTGNYFHFVPGVPNAFSGVVKVKLQNQEET